MSDTDLIVIGGGVHGLTLALLAAERGVRVSLMERGAPGAGASSGSLGILHGGLRHLPRLAIGRLRRSARGQAWFSRRFPEHVRPLACLLPLDGRGLRRGDVFGFALALEERIRGAKLPARGRILRPHEAASLCPAMRATSASGAAVWYDLAVADLGGLLAALADRARAAGAQIMANVEAEELQLDGAGAVRGVRGRDHARFARVALKAPLVVNCAGGEAAALARALDPQAPELFHPVLAFNLLLDLPAPFSGSLAIEGERRRYFLRPLRGRLLAGTEYAPADGPAQPSAEQARAFLAALARAAPSLGLQNAAILKSPFGLLPGVSRGGTQLLERDVIHDHGAHGGPKGLITAAGVKFTTAPETAEDVLSLAFPARRPGIRLRVPQFAGRLHDRIASGGAR